MIALTQKDLSELQATYAASCYYYEPKQIAGPIKSRVHVDAPPKPPQGDHKGQYRSNKDTCLEMLVERPGEGKPRHYMSPEMPVLPEM